jgi:hypothetical protein
VFITATRTGLSIEKKQKKYKFGMFGNYLTRREKHRLRLLQIVRQF